MSWLILFTHGHRHLTLSPEWSRNLVSGLRLVYYDITDTRDSWEREDCPNHGDASKKVDGHGEEASKKRDKAVNLNQKWIFCNELGASWADSSWIFFNTVNFSTLNNFQLFSAKNNFSAKYSPASIAIPMMGQPRSTTRMPPKKQPLPFNFSGCTKNLVDLLTPITSMRPENIEPYSKCL